MRNIPTITKNLLIINVLSFLAVFAFERNGINFNNIFGLHFILAENFYPYQFITYMFMHASIEHIFFNMFALWMFGCVMERTWGPKRFLFYYIVSGIGAGIIQEISQFTSLYLSLSSQIPNFSISQLFSLPHQDTVILNSWTTVGASGAIYSILLAFGMTYPNERLFIFPLPFPIRAKWFIGIYIIIELFSALGTSGDNVAHFAHLGGMLWGFLIIKYWQRNTYNHNNNNPFYKKKSIVDKIKDLFKNNSNKYKSNFTQTTNNKDIDWQYNKNKKNIQEETDRILDKIRKSGYESLSKEEKDFLFNNSKKM